MNDPVPTSPTLDDIVRALSQWRFRYASELELQQQLQEALQLAGLDPVREVILPAGRIDIMCGRVGIEVKVAGQAAQVKRQLARYASCDEIDALVLVTTRVRHQMPAQLGGKPVEVICLASGAFA
jgi:hypothetical protein